MYAREVFHTQNRRFALGFTIRGLMKRLWQFDRSGSSGPSSFDMDQDGLQFVHVMLGFYLMNDEQLGLDPTIQQSDGRRYVEITSGDLTQSDKIERLNLQRTLKSWLLLAERQFVGKHIAMETNRRNLSSLKIRSGSKPILEKSTKSYKKPFWKHLSGIQTIRKRGSRRKCRGVCSQDTKTAEYVTASKTLILEHAAVKLPQRSSQEEPWPPCGSPITHPALPNRPTFHHHRRPSVSFVLPPDSASD